MSQSEALQTCGGEECVSYACAWFGEQQRFLERLLVLDDVMQRFGEENHVKRRGVTHRLPIQKDFGDERQTLCANEQSK